MNMVANTQTSFSEESLLAANNFRLLLDAMAHPGKIYDVATQQESIGSFNAGATMILLALCDHETPVWLDENLAGEAEIDFLRFHCACPLSDYAQQAMFALLPSQFDQKKVGDLCLGTPAYPDRSTTVIIQVESLRNDGTLWLSGPGIKSTQSFHVEGLNNSFWKWRADNNRNFPLGTDVIFVTNNHLAALPRTTQVREVG